MDTKMRRCIFCMENKEELYFNKEHIILNSLGGNGNDDIFHNVCVDCNSKLGSLVDSLFVNDEVTRIYRYILKIKSRNGIQNPFLNKSFRYDNTPITGGVITNKIGDIIGFKADCKTYQLGDSTLIVAPRKNFCGYVNKYLKENGFPLLTEKEILENKLKIYNPKYPTIKSIKVDDDYKINYMHKACPLLLKMAYEFCFIRLGDQYLNDNIAQDIRECLNELKIDKTEIKIPTEMQVAYNDLEKKTSISFECDTINDTLYVCINIFGIINARILMTTMFHVYNLNNSNPIEYIY